MKKYVVSACLLGKNCKYNGGNNLCPKLVEFLKDKEVITVCPETAGGLPTPRIPIEIKDGRVINKDGVDKTANLILGTKKSLEKFKDEEIECFILKSRSPSCGSDFIYDGNFNKTLVKADGFFVRKIRKLGKAIYTEENFDELI